MNLTPREKDKLLVSVAAMVARRRLERGVKLTRDWQSALSVAEQKVETLLADAGLDDDPLPFEPEEDCSSAQVRGPPARCSRSINERKKTLLNLS